MSRSANPYLVLLWQTGASDLYHSRTRSLFSDKISLDLVSVCFTFRPIVTHGALGESGCAVCMYRMLECRPVVTS